MLRSKLKKTEIAEMFDRFRQAEPEPKGELVAGNPFTLLVAVVLSAQATDESVNRATPALFRIADTPATMAELGEEKIATYIKTIGLYRTKAKNVANLARILRDEYAGEVPMDREALQALPGVGRKTANVVLNMAFGHETFAVDTHVFRVSNRTGLAPGKSPEAVEAALERRVPEGFRLHAHHWLILHGRYTCKAKRPECWRCLIADLCKYEAKELNDPSASPSPGKRSRPSKTPA